MRIILTFFVLSLLSQTLPAQGINFTSSCDSDIICNYEDNCEPSFAELIVTANTDCASGLLTFYYSIDLNNDGSTDLSGSDNDASGNFPIGSHKITFNVVDDCGNSENCEYLFSIKDCVAPIPSINNGIALNLEFPGEVTLLAESLDNGSSDNCGVASFLIVSPSQGPLQTQPPTEASSSFTFTCNTTGTNAYDFWVSDEAGNWSYIPGYIIIQDNDFYCSVPGGDSFLLCTTAKTEDGDFIDHVDSQIGGYTGAPGNPLPDPFYVGSCATIYSQYINGFISLNPLKDINHLNGVSTFDMVLIAKHILNLQLLPSPYKMIAADVNNSGSISAIDLIELRKLIVNINQTFPNNKSWRFIDADFVFPNPNNPWATALPEICQIMNFDEDITKNYIGIKIGDVNGSAVSNDTLTSVEDRTINEALIFKIENQKFKADEETRLAFTSSDFKAISGFQFELSFDNESLEFQGFEKGNLSDFDENSLGFSQLQEGIISASWVNLNLDQIDNSDEPLFYLTFKSIQKGHLEDFIKITENRLKAEAYNNNLELLDLKIEFYDNTFNLETELFQNQPNPFHEETFISFYIPTAQTVKLKIFDVQGNPIKVIRNAFAEGYNQFAIQSGDITSTGVYYYQIITEQETITKKMIKL